jgi:hypothetical protein
MKRGKKEDKMKSRKDDKRIKGNKHTALIVTYIRALFNIPSLDKPAF